MGGGEPPLGEGRARPETDAAGGGAAPPGGPGGGGTAGSPGAGAGAGGGSVGVGGPPAHEPGGGAPAREPAAGFPPPAPTAGAPTPEPAGSGPPSPAPLGDGTRVIHAGLPAARQHEPLLPGPQPASVYHLAGDPTGHPLEYGRYGNPTWTRWEEALGELEGGRVVSFSSGMAAVAAVLTPRLRPGDTLLLPADGYPSVRDLASQLPGVELRTLPLADFPGSLDDVSFVWVESPSNPGLDVCDIAAVCAGAHDAGALVAVDNTLATPLGQRPLELGADFSVASDSKHATGHSDLILGHVAVSEESLADELNGWRRMTGAVPGPFEAWLAHRSLATLDVRLSRQCDTALQLATLLAARPDVSGVRYPGLADDPSHSIASRQMTRYGSIVGFDVGDRTRAQRFLAGCELVAEATSFGGVHSAAERRARWHGNDVGEGFIRFSVGCESADDLVAEVTRSLDASRP